MKKIHRVAGPARICSGTVDETFEGLQSQSQHQQRKTEAMQDVPSPKNTLHLPGKQNDITDQKKSDKNHSAFFCT